MSESALKLLEQVMALPPTDQAEFSRHLLDAEFPTDGETEAEATARWETELDRRLAEVADGSAESLPLVEAMAVARAELARRRDNG